jgi:hypothetical protein
MVAASDGRQLRLKLAQQQSGCGQGKLGDLRDSPNALGDGRRGLVIDRSAKLGEWVRGGTFSP